MAEHSPWPRLLASWDGRTLSMVHQHSNGRRAYASQRTIGHTDLLARALARGVHAGAHPLRHAAMVLTGGALGPGESVEGLRRSLGLQTLLLLQHEQALGLALQQLDPAQLAGLTWLTPASLAGSPALLCCLGESSADHQLIAADGRAPAALQALLLHPLSPQDADEHLLLAQSQREGRALRLGQLLGPQGMVLAYQLLARGEGRETAPPVSPEWLLAQAPQDALARRASALACGALTTLSALLALAGIHRLLFCGRVLRMRRALQDHACLPRLAQLLDGAAEMPSIALWDTEALTGDGPLQAPCLRGAAHALALHWQAQQQLGEDSMQALVRARYDRLTRTERRMADLVLTDAQAVLCAPTAQLAQDAGISQPQVIRFCRSLGFDGVTEFRRALGASLARLAASGVSSASPTPCRYPMVEQSAQALTALRLSLDPPLLTRAARALKQARRVELLTDAACTPLADWLVGQLWRQGLAAHCRRWGEPSHSKSAQVLCLIVSSSASAGTAQLAAQASAALQRGETVLLITDEPLALWPIGVLSLSTGREPGTEGERPLPLLSAMLLQLLLREMEALPVAAAEPDRAGSLTSTS